MVDLFVGLHENLIPQQKSSGKIRIQLFAKQRAFAATWWSWAPLWVAGHGVSLGNLASMPWQTALFQAYRPGDRCLFFCFFFREIVKMGDRLKMNNGCFFFITSGVFFFIEDYIFTIQLFFGVIANATPFFFVGGGGNEAWFKMANVILRYFLPKNRAWCARVRDFLSSLVGGGNQEVRCRWSWRNVLRLTVELES